MKSNDSLKQYLREIKKLLPCDYALKKRYIAGLSESIQPYLQEHPDTTLHDLHAVFGAPETIIEDYLNNADAVEVSKRLSRKKFVIVGIVIVAVLALILAVVAIRVTRDVHEIQDGYITQVVLEPNTSPTQSPIEVH